MRALSELRPTAPTPEATDASSASRCDRGTLLAAVTGLQITTDVLRATRSVRGDLLGRRHNRIVRQDQVSLEPCPAVLRQDGGWSVER